MAQPGEGINWNPVALPANEQAFIDSMKSLGLLRGQPVKAYDYHLRDTRSITHGTFQPDSGVNLYNSRFDFNPADSLTTAAHEIGHSIARPTTAYARRIRDLMTSRATSAPDYPQFLDWYKQAARLTGLSLDPHDPQQAYDYYGYFKDVVKDNPEGWLQAARIQLAASPDTHLFTDRFKFPNHPTFSEESLFSGGDETGGTWQGETFIPSEFNKKFEAARPIYDAMPYIGKEAEADSIGAALRTMYRGTGPASDRMVEMVKGYIDATKPPPSPFDSPANRWGDPTLWGTPVGQ